MVQTLDHQRKVTMELVLAEKTQVDNLILLVSKAEANLKGVEILAAADAMKWLSSFQARLNRAIQDLSKPVEMTVTSTPPIVVPEEEPQPIENGRFMTKKERMKQKFKGDRNDN